jgi:hypothetical protein
VDDDRRQVAKMVAPRWLRGGSTDETISRFPSRRQLEQAIRPLDGKEFHDLFIYLSTSDIETFLGISGGAGCFVGISDHAERVGQVLNTDDPSDVRNFMMCGGVPTSIPRRFLVDLQAAVDRRRALPRNWRGGSYAQLEWC